MNRHAIFGGGKIGKRVLIAALCLAAVPAFAQTNIDTAFARKLYSAGNEDRFKVEVGLKNTAYWLYNDSLKSDRPIACDKTKQDCSPAAFRLVEVIDTAKTDAFFKRHEILATADGKSFISKPSTYARNYEVYISPTEVIYFMEDTLVERLADLEAARPVSSLGRWRPHGNGYRPFATYRMGQWLLGRKTGPRPEAFLKLP